MGPLGGDESSPVAAAVLAVATLALVCSEEGVAAAPAPADPAIVAAAAHERPRKRQAPIVAQPTPRCRIDLHQRGLGGGGDLLLALPHAVLGRAKGTRARVQAHCDGNFDGHATFFVSIIPAHHSSPPPRTAAAAAAGVACGGFARGLDGGGKLGERGHLEPPRGAHDAAHAHPGPGGLGAGDDRRHLLFKSLSELDIAPQ